MQILYLITAVLCAASTSVFAGFYTRKTAKCRDASALYSLLLLAAVSVSWLVLFLTDRTVHVGVLPYSLLFALFYSVGTIGIAFATRYGPVSLTSLLLQSSLVLVTVWGFIFWDTPITPIVLIGLCLVLISLSLCLYQRSGKQEGLSLKWLLFALMGFLGNAGCSIVQRTQQVAFNGAYSNMLMAAASLLSLLVCLLLYLRSNRCDTRAILKRAWYVPLVAGLLNVGLNMLVMLMAVGSLSPSLIYPSLSVGGLILATLFSATVLRERLRATQWAGIAIGLVATLLLSL